MAEECLFCSIASGEKEAEVLYEDDGAIAFEDINPKAPVHFLVVPKKHVASVNDLSEADEELVGRLYTVARELAAEQGFARDGYRLVVNCGYDAKQTVDHLHLHCLAGRSLDWPPG